MKRVPISFEFFPPNTPVGDEKLKTVVQELGAMQPEFFSVTYGAGGSTREKTLKTVVAICQAAYRSDAGLATRSRALAAAVSSWETMTRLRSCASKSLGGSSFASARMTSSIAAA